ncbi:vacuolar protein sorting-associated protein 26C [Chrysoperla carnea]|uniref:vacuolar protein sorting-associated protein 26C n=1 Tax=Chrysoperla carnea TaxID=189513 RepID=UPI001D088994|nr:vacuolar protein sorting-associated protein 26C [Chrysoperla carnea]
MSSISLDIKLKKYNKVYYEGDILSGVIQIVSPTDFKYDAITLTMDGAVNLQLSAKNNGIFEAFYNSVKPIQLAHTCIDVLNAGGRLPSGTTEIPFEIPLKSNKPGRILYETYQGVFVNISYTLKCDVRRSFLAKDLTKTNMFIVQYKPQDKLKLDHPVHPVKFTISPESLQNRDRIGASNIPRFLITGYLNNTICLLTEPFTGELIVQHTELPIKSIELQLVRVETCGCAEGYSRDATEIQNIQIGEGSVPFNLGIPIHMIFPRLFTCPTLSTTNFKVEFEVNIVIIFQNDHLITENFPITLIR